jgi:hypothetical protein
VKHVKSLFHYCFRPGLRVDLECDVFSELEARKQISRFELQKPAANEKQAKFDAALGKVSDKNSVKAVKQALKTILTPPEPDKAHENRKGILMPWKGDSSWGAMSTRPEFILQALIGAPLPIPTARLVKGDYLRHLQLTSQSFPAIIGVIFLLQHSAPTVSGWPIDKKKDTVRQFKKNDSLGGHFVVCVGPNHSGSQFIVLDPMNGLKYIDRADVTADCILYDDGAAIGKVDEDIRKLSRNPQKVDVGLVDHVSQKGLSRCCLIVTHPWEPGD